MFFYVAGAVGELDAGEEVHVVVFGELGDWVHELLCLRMIHRRINTPLNFMLIRNYLEFLRRP